MLVFFWGVINSCQWSTIHGPASNQHFQLWIYSPTMPLNTSLIVSQRLAIFPEAVSGCLISGVFNKGLHKKQLSDVGCLEAFTIDSLTDFKLHDQHDSKLEKYQLVKVLPFNFPINTTKTSYRPVDSIFWGLPKTSFTISTFFQECIFLQDEHMLPIPGINPFHKSPSF